MRPGEELPDKMRRRTRNFLGEKAGDEFLGEKCGVYQGAFRRRSRGKKGGEKWNKIKMQGKKKGESDI